VIREIAIEFFDDLIAECDVPKHDRLLTVGVNPTMDNRFASRR